MGASIILQLLSTHSPVSMTSVVLELMWESWKIKWNVSKTEQEQSSTRSRMCSPTIWSNIWSTSLLSLWIWSWQRIQHPLLLSRTSWGGKLTSKWICELHSVTTVKWKPPTSPTASMRGQVVPSLFSHLTISGVQYHSLIWTPWEWWREIRSRSCQSLVKSFQEWTKSRCNRNSLPLLFYDSLKAIINALSMMILIKWRILLSFNNRWFIISSLIWEVLRQNFILKKSMVNRMIHRMRTLKKKTSVGQLILKRTRKILKRMQTLNLRGGMWICIQIQPFNLLFQLFNLLLSQLASHLVPPKVNLLFIMASIPQLKKPSRNMETLASWQLSRSWIKWSRKVCGSLCIERTLKQIKSKKLFHL